MEKAGARRLTSRWRSSVVTGGAPSKGGIRRHARTQRGADEVTKSVHEISAHVNICHQFSGTASFADRANYQPRAGCSTRGLQIQSGGDSACVQGSSALLPGVVAGSSLDSAPLGLPSPAAARDAAISDAGLDADALAMLREPVVAEGRLAGWCVWADPDSAPHGLHGRASLQYRKGIPMSGRVGVCGRAGHCRRRDHAPCGCPHGPAAPCDAGLGSARSLVPSNTSTLTLGGA